MRARRFFLLFIALLTMPIDLVEAQTLAPWKRMDTIGGSDIFVIPTNGHILYYRGRRVFDKLARSTDEGKTWDTVASPRIPWSLRRQFFIRESNTLVFAGNNDINFDTCVAISTNEGSSWTYPTGIRAKECAGIAMLRTGALLALLNKADPQDTNSPLVISDDDGRNWKPFSTPPILTQWGNGDIAVDSSGAILLSCTPKSWRSTDQGQTWEEFTSLQNTGPYGRLVVSRSNNYLLLYDDNAYYSSDQGKFWYPVAKRSRGAASTPIPQLLPDGTIYSYSIQGVDYSSDGGGTWKSDTSGLPSSGNDPAFFEIKTDSPNRQMVISMPP